MTHNMGVVPKLLPVTATFALPVAALQGYLQYNCIMARFETETYLGTDSSKSLKNDSATKASVVKDGASGEMTYNDPMLVASTAHRNFLENAPFAVLFGALVELNGGSRQVLTGVLGVFTVARVLHALGIGKPKMLWARQAGFFGSFGSVTGLAAWTAWLVKGYWGL